MTFGFNLYKIIILQVVIYYNDILKPFKGDFVMYYGYHRVSTKQQHLDRGVESIENFCKERNYPLAKVFTDKISGKKFDRPRFTVLKEDVLRSGDVLILHELDRLARTKKAIAEELAYFDKIGVRVMILNIPTTLIDLSSAPEGMYKTVLETINHIVIEIYSMQAQTELELKEKRQREGIEAMKNRGDWDRYGRPRKMSKEDFAKEYQSVRSGEIGSLALMRKLGLNRDTYFRYVREYKKENS